MQAVVIEQRAEGLSGQEFLGLQAMWSQKWVGDQVCKDGALLNPFLWSGSSQRHTDASYLKVHHTEPVVLGLPVQSCVVWHFNQILQDWKTLYLA